MGQRGPQPLPANVHRLRGNPSKMTAAELRALDAVQPEVEIPGMPPHLKGEARKEWIRVSVELERLGLVTRIDRAALALYCGAWGRLVQAERKLHELGDAGVIERTPNGFQVQGVWLNIANKAAEQVSSFLAAFGMSPSSRARVTPSVAQADLFDGTADERPTWGSFRE